MSSVLLSILFLFQTSYAQVNLVPNSSFELYTTCPLNNDLSSIKTYTPEYWYKPDYKLGGYWNACAGNAVYGIPKCGLACGYGFQYARTGVGYVGMFYYNGNDSRNYFQVQLQDSLMHGKCYYAECYVNLGNCFKLGCNNQAILFTTTPIYADTGAVPPKQIIPANPQILNYGNPIITDTLDWVKVSGIFVSQGGERYLTLGNFKYNSQTNYAQFNPSGGYNGAAYLVDDVSLYELDSFPLKADAGPDTTIAQGTSVFIGTLTNGITNIHWYNAAGQLIDSTRPGFNVTPDSTTFYIVEQTVCGHTSRDTVTITVNPLPLHWLSFTATALNNEAVGLNWQTANEENVSHINIQRSTKGTQDFQTIATLPATNKPHNQYSYLDHSPFTIHHSLLYRLQSIDTDGRRSYSQVRRVSLTTDHSPVTIYPNPATGVVNISFPKIKQVTLIDVTGKQVLQQAFGDQSRVQIDCGRLPNGLYLVRIIDSKSKVSSQKLIIKRP